MGTSSTLGIPVTPLFHYDQTMPDLAKSLPEDPEDLRRFTAFLLAEVKSQALLIAKLRHQPPEPPEPPERTGPLYSGASCRVRSC
jgi:hypothetical protein